jgi:HEAT repeat protein
LRAIEPLKHAQNDSDIHVVMAANGALLELDQSNTINELICKFNDVNTQRFDLFVIAVNLKDITEKIGTNYVKNISNLCVSILKGNDPIRFTAICEGNRIGAISKHHALKEERILFIKLLISALNHKEYKIRSSAADALGEILRDDLNIEQRDVIINKLISMIDDDIFDVRRSTIISLCQYIKDPRAIEPLQKAADKGGDDRDMILRQLDNLKQAT